MKTKFEEIVDVKSIGIEHNPIKMNDILKKAIDKAIDKKLSLAKPVKLY